MHNKMKRFFLVMALGALAMTMSGAKKVAIDHIEPANWFVGMKNPQLQLMVYGKGIRDVQSVTTTYPGVRIDSLVRLDSPNYLLVYMNVKDAQPGTMTLNFQSPTSKIKPPLGRRKLATIGTQETFELKAREKKGEERQGFDISDVLYLLMPDRFASGRSDNDQIKGMNTYVNDRTQPSLRHGGDMEGILCQRSHATLVATWW